MSSAHRYTRIQTRHSSSSTPASATTPSATAGASNVGTNVVMGGITSIGPPGVDWGGDIGAPVTDPLAAFGFNTQRPSATNTNTSTVNNAKSSSSVASGGAFGGLTVTTTTMSAMTRDNRGGSSGYPTPPPAFSTQHGSASRAGRDPSLGTPPELKAANLAGFLAANKLSGGGLVASPSNPSGSMGAASMENLRRSSQVASVYPPAHHSNHVYSSSAAYASTASSSASSGLFPSVPSQHTPSAYPSANVASPSASAPSARHTSPPAQNHSTSGGQTFSGANILSSLAAAAAQRAQGSSPPSLSPTTTSGSSNAAGLNILALISRSGGTPATSNTNINGAATAQSSHTAISGAKPAAASTLANTTTSASVGGSNSGGCGEVNVADLFQKATVVTSTATAAVNQQRSGVSASATAASPSSTLGHVGSAKSHPQMPTAVGATPPHSQPSSRLTSPTAGKHSHAVEEKYGGSSSPHTTASGTNPSAPPFVPSPATIHNTNNNNASTHAKKQDRNGGKSAHHSGVEPAALQSRVIMLPPQHEIFVQFPSEDAVRTHLKIYGANYNVVAPRGSSFPESPSRQTSASSPGANVGGSQVVSGASSNANLDAAGIASLFAAASASYDAPFVGGAYAPSPSTQQQSSSNKSGGKGKDRNKDKDQNDSLPALPRIPAGYYIGKPAKTPLRPRVYVFGKCEYAPFSVCQPAGEFAGILFRNEGVYDHETSASSNGGFVDVNFSASGVFSESDLGDVLSSSSSATPPFSSYSAVSVSAEVIIYNAASIGPIRPTDSKAKDIHEYLNALRIDALAHNTRGPNVLIVGNTDTGKSSLSNYLVSAHIKESFASFMRFKDAAMDARLKARKTLINSLIQLLDLDVGQQGASLPGCVSAVNYMHHNKSLLQNGQSVFYGDTSIHAERDKKNYLHCVDALMKLSETVLSIDRSEIDRRRMHHYPHAVGRIINTMGYVEDAGFDILVELIGICKVDVVIVTGNNSSLQFRLQDAITKRYVQQRTAGGGGVTTKGKGGEKGGRFVPTSAVNALYPSNAHVSKHFAMPTFLLYNAPDCPRTPQGIRRAKREERIEEYFRTVRFGERTLVTNNGVLSSSTPSASPMGGKGTPQSIPNSSFGYRKGGGGPTPSSFPSNPSAVTTMKVSNPSRLFVYKVPLSRLDIREAKTFIPITGQAFLKMGSKKLAAIPLPTYNEIGGGDGKGFGSGSTGSAVSFFPLLEPAVPDESKLTTASAASSVSSKNTTAPSSPNANSPSYPSTAVNGGPLVANPHNTEIDHLLLPNSRGVIAFAIMMGLTANNDAVELIFDPAHVEEKLREASVLRGGSWSASTEREPADTATIIKAFLSPGDFSRERITLLLSNIPVPDETIQMMTAAI